MTITRSWLRFWRGGPGVAWKPSAAPLTFSQRLGYTRTVVVFGYRFWWLHRGPREWAMNTTGMSDADIAKTTAAFADEP